MLGSDDCAAAKATPGLLQLFPTPQAIALVVKAIIAKHISRQGLPRNKLFYHVTQQLLGL